MAPRDQSSGASSQDAPVCIFALLVGEEVSARGALGVKSKPKSEVRQESERAGAGGEEEEPAEESGGERILQVSESRMRERGSEPSRPAEGGGFEKRASGQERLQQSMPAKERRCVL